MSRNASVTTSTRCAQIFSRSLKRKGNPMRATVMYRAGDVRIENVPDATIVHPTDAVIRITRACICGSDLWPYNELEPTPAGRRMGHEAIGVVETVGADVRLVRRSDVVVMPFAYSDGTCMFCDDGLQTSCIHGGFLGTGGEASGAQAEALRVSIVIRLRLNPSG